MTSNRRFQEISGDLPINPVTIMIKKLALGIMSLGLMVVAAQAQIAGDNAGNYGGGWTNGTNGGTGFTAWDLTQNNNNGVDVHAGYFLGDSTAGGSGNINTSGNSFGVFANQSGSTTAFANALRTFTEGNLTLGQTFSIQLAVNFRNGDKGLTLSNGGTEVFDFNVGPPFTNAADDYTYSVNGGGQTSLGLAYEPDSVFTLSFTQGSANNVVVKIVRATSELGTETPLNSTFQFGPINAFKLYNSGTADGGADNNLYFNNLAITVIPEPSTLVLLAGPALLGGWSFLIRRRNS